MSHKLNITFKHKTQSQNLQQNPTFQNSADEFNFIMLYYCKYSLVNMI